MSNSVGKLFFVPTETLLDLKNGTIISGVLQIVN